MLSSAFFAFDLISSNSVKNFYLLRILVDDERRKCHVIQKRIPVTLVKPWNEKNLPITFVKPWNEKCLGALIYFILFAQLK